MRSIAVNAVSFAFLLVSFATSFAQENEVEKDKKDKEPSPLFISWEKHPIGTTTTMSSRTNADGQEVATMMITSKLVSKDSDKVVLEMSTKINAGGREIETSASNVNIEKFSQMPAIWRIPKDTAESKTEKGEETLKVGGKSYDCKWARSIMKTAAGETTTKSWMCDDVPGMIVKTVSKTGANETTMKLENIEKE